MKKICMVALCLLVTSFALSANEKGVKFEEGTLTELLAKAGAEDKYLFVDMYTTWCGPCRYMTGKIFPQESMGNYFNATFVNAKFDAEEGEGIEIARRYGVTAYPTFLILNSEGKEVGRIIGGDTAKGFIQKTQRVVSKIK